MFKYIGLAEIINIFILPYIGLILCLIWYFSENKNNKKKK